MSNWDGVSNIDVAVMVDIDGTLCSPPVCGKRVLRPDAVEALREYCSMAVASRRLREFMDAAGSKDSQ